MTTETSEKQVGSAMSQRQTKIKLKATKGHPFIAAGKVFEIHPVHEPALRSNGWAVGESEDHTKVKEADIKKIKTSAENAGAEPVA